MTCSKLGAIYVAEIKARMWPRIFTEAQQNGTLQHAGYHIPSEPVPRKERPRKTIPPTVLEQVTDYLAPLQIGTEVNRDEMCERLLGVLCRSRRPPRRKLRSKEIQAARKKITHAMRYMENWNPWHRPGNTAANIRWRRVR